MTTHHLRNSKRLISGDTLQEDIDSYENYIGYVISGLNEYTPFNTMLYLYVIIFDEINSTFGRYPIEDANRYLDVILQNLYIIKMDEDHWRTLKSFITKIECRNVPNDQLKRTKDYVISLFVLIGNT